MLKRLFCKCLLRPEDFEPSDERLEVIGAFNPGAIEFKDEVVLLVRIAERPRETRPGFTALPRRDPENNLVIDWVSDNQIEPLDPRVVRRRHDGLVRLNFTSHIRVVRSRDGRSIDSVEGARFMPESPYEEFGVEDPRITRIAGMNYFTFVAVSRHGAATALASTSDFETFERHGLIFCPENKDVVLFPEEIGGTYAALHRPNAATPFCFPEMWIAHSDDLIHWGRHEHFFGGESTWETGRIGAGTPPLRTDLGWLEIYHGNRAPKNPGDVGIYSAGAFLLDFENPRRIVRHTPEPIFIPETDFEREGFVPNVVFPTGVVERRDSLLIYYGAADTFVGVVEFSRTELFSTMT